MVEKRDGCRDGDETEGDEEWFPGDHAGAGSFELFAEIDQAIGGVGMGEDFHLPVGNLRDIAAALQGADADVFEAIRGDICGDETVDLATGGFVGWGFGDEASILLEEGHGSVAGVFDEEDEVVGLDGAVVDDFGLPGFGAGEGHGVDVDPVLIGIDLETCFIVEDEFEGGGVETV
jgi:hypothetical protein